MLTFYETNNKYNYKIRRSDSSVHLPTSPQDATQNHFLAEFNRFEFRVFLLLDLLSYFTYISALLFSNSLRDNSWIHTFPKGIIAM